MPTTLPDRRLALAILGALGFASVVAALTGCRGSTKPEPDRGAASATAEKSETKLVVFAATSLRDAFTSLASEFKKSHAGVDVTFNFAGRRRSELSSSKALSLTFSRRRTSGT
jgi:molybdate transport system substrate-binding protein